MNALERAFLNNGFEATEIEALRAELAETKQALKAANDTTAEFALQTLTFAIEAAEMKNALDKAKQALAEANETSTELALQVLVFSFESAEMEETLDKTKRALEAAEAGWAASEADCAQARADNHALLVAYRDLITTMEG